MRQKQTGISLLEVLLSIMVGALIIFIAVRLYVSAHESVKINKFLTNVNNIVDASYQWYQGQPTGFANINAQMLEDAGYIDASSFDNPWDSSNIKIGPGDTNDSLQITANMPDEATCNLISGHLSHAAQTEKCKKNNTYIGTF